MSKLNQQLINHVVFVLDASGSMAGLRDKVIEVFNAQVANLVEQSKRWDQETRVTVYVFGNTSRCVVYDKDVLRLPSIEKDYFDGGMTSLIDAVYQSQTELAQTATLYGDHAFLTFVLTDGEENNSRLRTPGQLATLIAGQPENWTLACLVPNILCKKQAAQFGFPADNIMIWDTTTVGLEKVADTVTTVTDTYFSARASGVRGSKTLFSGVTASAVSTAAVAASGMKPVDPSTFVIVPVALASTSTLPIVIPTKSITRKNPHGVKHVEIMPFIEETGRRYVAGNAFYELVKSEKYDYHKDVVLIHRTSKKVYRGDEAKGLIGLTGTSTRIRPMPVKGGDYDIFIQSQSVNRHLPIGSRVLLFTK